jgi:hypothetical protein
MILLIISTLFVCIAAASNAVMDKLQFHFYKSIFKSDKFDNWYWDPSSSWLNKYVDKNVHKGIIKWGIFDKPVCLTDAWHLFKTIMIFSIFISLTCVLFIDVQVDLLVGILYFCVMGTIWNLVFNLFFNKLLVRK